MFGFKKKIGRPTKSGDGRAVYKQVAVTPAAHAKLRELADENDSTIIDTVDRVLGV